MASQRLDEIRNTLKEQREALWEGAIKADPELFVRLAKRIGLSRSTRSTGEQPSDSYWRTLPAGNPENHAPDTLSAQREKLWESAIKADPELFFKAAEKAGLGNEIRPFADQADQADQADHHSPSSHDTDDPTFSHEPRQPNKSPEEYPMSPDNLTYEDWKAAIESDPELFLALAEEIGLRDRIRAAVLGSTPAPSDRMMAIMDRITKLRTELEALHNELEALKTGADQNHSHHNQGGPRSEITQRATREPANLEARRTASGDRQPVAVNDPGRMNAHGRNGLALIEKMEALDKDEGPRVVALVDRESNEFSMIRVDPGDLETRLLNNEPGKRVHHYQMSQFAQLFWMTPADRFNVMDYQDWSKVAQFIRKATVAAQLDEPDITSTFADTPHLMAAHPTLPPDIARERLNLLERYPSVSDTQTKLELTEILMAHRHGVAPDRSLFSQESLQSTPFAELVEIAELVEMTEPEAIHAEVEEKYYIAHRFGAKLKGDKSRGYEISPMDMLRYDTMLQEVRELKRLQQAVNARHGSAADVSDDPDDFMRPM